MRELAISYKLDVEIVEQIQQAETAIKELKKLQDGYKAKLLELMEEHQIKDIENDQFKVMYFPQSEKPSLDTDKLKTEHEEVYLECLKKSTTKSFIKITLK